MTGRKGLRSNIIRQSAKMIRVLLGFFLLAGFVTCKRASHQQGQQKNPSYEATNVVVIANSKIIDVKTGAVNEHLDIIIRDNLIADIVPRIQVMQREQRSSTGCRP